MELSQFEKSVSKVFLTRGRKYYKEGHVEELVQLSPTAWRAEVVGVAEYFVFVELRGDLILTSVCNCPFDGACCKHEVAVYYAIREALNRRPKKELPEGMQSKSKDELLALLEEMVNDFPLLSIYLERGRKETNRATRYVQEAAATIQWSVELALMDFNWIEEEDAERAFQGFYEVLEQAQDVVEEDPVCAMQLLLICMAQATVIDIYCDEFVWETLDEFIFHQAMALIATMQEEEAAVAVTQLLLSELASGGQDEVLLLQYLIELSPFAQSRAQVEHAIQVADLSVEGRAAFSLDLLLKVGQAEEITSYYTREPMHASLRDRLIEYAITQQDLETALLLCANGIEQAGESEAHKRSWLEKAFHLHGTTNNLDAQRFIAFELAIKGQLADVARLKSLYAEDAALWAEVLENYLVTLEEAEYKAGHYAELLAQEGEWVRLMRYCQQEPQSLLRYAKALTPYYKEEVQLLMANYFQQKALTLTARGSYRSFAQELLAYAKNGYEEHALALKALFEKTYARKPAFLEELSAVQENDCY